MAEISEDVIREFVANRKPKKRKRWKSKRTREENRKRFRKHCHRQFQMNKANDPNLIPVKKGNLEDLLLFDDYRGIFLLECGGFRDPETKLKEEQIHG